MPLTRLKRPFGDDTLILIAAAIITAGCNRTFFANVLEAYPPGTTNPLHLASLVLVCLALNAALLALPSWGRLLKPILAVAFLGCATIAYFVDSYGVVISDEMLRNLAQTNAAEAFDLVTPTLLLYLLLLGVLPAAVLGLIPRRPDRTARALWVRFRLISALAVVIVAAIVPFSDFYASFAREHKALRTHFNPAYPLYSAVKFAHELTATAVSGTVAVVGDDAHIPPTDVERELVFLVVGETARADRFSINGYGRPTTPRLEAEMAISFTEFRACGTSTAVSVPCMFSTVGMDKFDLKTSGTRENLLDVLRHAGVNVLWLENNSDSKGVALRTPYRNFRTPAVNPRCDDECRDEGMLVDLQRYIDEHPRGDILVVMHQMGNHGPAYFKRYPAAFERFTPACRNSDLSRCSDQEIGNAYDNAILYTDHFLGEAIALLKRNEKRFETALFYVSDHGESLGEKGLYLHGTPRAVAPDSQLHVPAVLWLGASYDDVDADVVRRKRHRLFTHDSVVHTVLGLMEIRTEVYRPELDLLDGARIAK